MLITTELQPVSYSIEAPGVGYYYNGTVTSNNVAIVDLDDSVIVSSHLEQNKGIHLTTDSDRVTVIGQTMSSSSSDTFLVLSMTNFCAVEYVYYGMSVSRTTLNIPDAPPVTSIVLVVGTEDNTTIKLTASQLVNISVDNFTVELTADREYFFVINKLQTVLIESLDDLTGTKVTTDKQVSVFSGHQNANVPQSAPTADHLIEQIPPTKFWGEVYYVTPLATRGSYTVKVLAAYNSTNVTIYCNNILLESYGINEGEFITRTYMLQEHCAIHSNKKVIVVQISHGASDDSTDGDPMMTLVPATIQYLNRFTINGLYSSNYINIIVLAEYYQPSMIYLRTGGVNMSLDSQEWVPIVVNNITEAYAAQVTVSEGVVQLVHTNKLATMTALVYGFPSLVGYGHPGGLKLHATTGSYIMCTSSISNLNRTSCSCFSIQTSQNFN